MGDFLGHPLSPAEPRQALRLLSSRAVSSRRVRAIYSVTNLKQEFPFTQNYLYSPTLAATACFSARPASLKVFLQIMHNLSSFLRQNDLRHMLQREKGL